MEITLLGRVKHILIYKFFIIRVMTPAIRIIEVKTDGSRSRISSPIISLNLRINA